MHLCSYLLPRPPSGTPLTPVAASLGSVPRTDVEWTKLCLCFWHPAQDKRAQKTCAARISERHLVLSFLSQQHCRQFCRGDEFVSDRVELYFGLEEGSAGSGACGHVQCLDLGADYMGVVSL